MSHPQIIEQPRLTQICDVRVSLMQDNGKLYHAHASGAAVLQTLTDGYGIPRLRLSTSLRLLTL
jgi:hypothetical protein